MRHMLAVLAVAAFATAPAGFAAASCYNGHTASMSTPKTVAELSTPAEEESVSTHEEVTEPKLEKAAE